MPSWSYHSFSRSIARLGSMDVISRTARYGQAFAPSGARVPYRFGSGGETDDGGAGPSRGGPVPLEGEDLPYRVELWDESKTAIEQVLAVTVNASIGYAAYYGATREFPNRYVTLRHKNSIISRWNGPGH